MCLPIVIKYMWIEKRQVLKKLPMKSDYAETPSRSSLMERLTSTAEQIKLISIEINRVKQIKILNNKFSTGTAQCKQLDCYKSGARSQSQHIIEHCDRSGITDKPNSRGGKNS